MGICLSVPVKISNRGVACNHVDRVGLEVTVVEVAETDVCHLGKRVAKAASV